MLRILPSGTHALLLELDDLDEVWAWYAALLDAGLPGVVDIVPAARTVLVVVGDDPVGTSVSPAGGGARGPGGRPRLDALADRVRAMRPAPHRAGAGAGEDELVVDVVYDGEDLSSVASGLGVGEAEFVRWHTSVDWVVAFCGFAPGYGYLVTDGGGPGGAAQWEVPRLTVPRTRVPAGSIGLAGAFSCIYPSSSPGGWQLVGRTTITLFDPEREPAVLLRPGRRVRFVEVSS
jgi:allophanate hydrolase subunit 1